MNPPRVAARRPIAAPTILAATLCLASCEVIPPHTESTAHFDFQPRLLHPRRDAAVLLVSENLDFSSVSDFTGGPVTWRNLCKAFAGALQKAGLDCDLLQADAETPPLDTLAHYRALYLIDCNAVPQALRERLEEYVRGGGVLVAVGETGRFDDGWIRPWPFGPILGLEMTDADPWHTGVSWADDETDIYHRAYITDHSSLLVSNLSDTVDWGPFADRIWVTRPAGAAVIAAFPAFLLHRELDGIGEKVNRSVPALTVNRLGAGQAVYCAVLPSGRQPEKWNRPLGDSIDVLARAPRLSSGTITLPPDLPRVTLGINQVGYQPEWPRQAVLRISWGKRLPPIRAEFTVRREGRQDITARGSFRQWDHDLWGDRFLTADLEEAVSSPGKYILSVSIPALRYHRDLQLVLATDILARVIIPTQLHFLRGMRCGEKCHRNDPVKGGYHDATGDWGVRMWSMPHLVWGLARYAEAHPEAAAINVELRRATDWCLAMQAPDGAVYAAVRPPGESGSPILLRPWQDHTRREIDKSYSFNYTATYAAALARAAAALRTRDAVYADRLLAAARRAFARIMRDKPKSTADLGNRCWAAAELQQAGAGDYLDRVRADIPEILRRQLKPGRVKGAAVHGDFFADKECTTFSPQQWKVFHSIGIYLGLIEINRLLPADDPLRARIRQALQAFADGYLLGMSALTPYGEIASGLEPDEDGTLQVYFFSHRKAWIHDHGLNCDMLAMGLVALELAADTGDAALRRMAARQVNWLLGCNPVGYCMITGLGTNPAPLIDPSLGTGPINGGIPNGIIGRGSDNHPVWGASWDSREYWLPHNAYLIALASLLERQP